MTAHLYAPPRPGGRRPALVLSLGVSDLGLADPRAIKLAGALARSGFVVMVLAAWQALLARGSEADMGVANAPSVVGAAFDDLLRRPEVDPRRVGFVGVCVGAAVSLVAAAQPRRAEQVAFVYAVGPYLSLRDLLWATTSRTTRSTDGRYRDWQPSPWVFERLRGWLLEALDPADRAPVLAALAGDESRDLSCRAEAVLELLHGAPSERTAPLIDRLGEPVLSALEAASPRRWLAGLRAPTYVMHSVSDDYVPVDESRRLVRALRDQVPLRYAEFELFDHVDASRALGALAFAREVWRLVRHVEPLLRLAA